MVIWVAVYTARMTALFGETNEVRKLESVDEIADSVFDVSTRSEYETWLEHGILKNVEENRLHFHKFEIDNLTFVREMLDSNHIWIDSDRRMEYLEKKIPNLYMLDGFVTHIGFSFAVRKKWKWFDQMGEKFTDYGREGILSRLDWKYRRNERRYSHGPTSVLSMPFQNFLGLFCIMMVNVFFSLILMFASFIRPRIILRKRGTEPQAALGGPKTKSITEVQTGGEMDGPRNTPLTESLSRY